MAAGVRSMSRLPSGPSLAALASWALAEVASKMMSMSVEVRQGHEAVDAFVGRLDAQPLGAGEAVGVGVDADHGAHLEVLWHRGGP